MWNSILIRSTWWGLLHRPLLQMSHCHCHLTYYLKQGSHIFAGLRHVLVCLPLLTIETTNFLLLSATTSILLVLLSGLFFHISRRQARSPTSSTYLHGIAPLLEFLVRATTKIALGTLATYHTKTDHQKAKNIDWRTQGKQQQQWEMERKMKQQGEN